MRRTISNSTRRAEAHRVEWATVHSIGRGASMLTPHAVPSSVSLLTTAFEICSEAFRLLLSLEEVQRGGQPASLVQEAPRAHHVHGRAKQIAPPRLTCVGDVPRAKATVLGCKEEGRVLKGDHIFLAHEAELGRKPRRAVPVHRRVHRRPRLVPSRVAWTLTCLRSTCHNIKAGEGERWGCHRGSRDEGSQRAEDKEGVHRLGAVPLQVLVDSISPPRHQRVPRSSRVACKLLWL
jgi:hypothetical protein